MLSLVIQHTYLLAIMPYERPSQSSKKIVSRASRRRSVATINETPAERDFSASNGASQEDTLMNVPVQASFDLDVESSDSDSDSDDDDEYMDFDADDQVDEAEDNENPKNAETTKRPQKKKLVQPSAGRGDFPKTSRGNDDDDIMDLEPPMSTKPNSRREDDLMTPEQPLSSKPKTANDDDDHNDETDNVLKRNKISHKKRPIQAPSSSEKKVKISPISRNSGLDSSSVVKSNTKSSSVASEQNQVTILRNEIGMLRGVIEDMCTSIKTVVDKRIADSNDLQTRVIEEVKDLRAVLDLSVLNPKKNKKDSVKQAAFDVPFFNIVFSEEVVQIVIEKCTIGHVSSTATDYRTRKEKKKSEVDMLARGAALALRVMFFAVNQKKKENRLMYQTELGKKFSEYREGIVLTALTAAKQNKFNLFRSSEDDNDSGDNNGGDIKSRKVNIPKWLRTDFVTSEHITVARVRTEETADGKGSDNKSQSSTRVDTFIGDPDGELAVYVASMMYKRFTQRLNSARLMGKAGFFDELGYLFVDWKRFRCKADQSTLKIRWLDEKASSKFPDINSIPDTIPKYTSKQSSSGDEKELASINAKNKALLRDLKMNCSAMQLEVEHEVCIRKNSKKATGKKEAKKINSSSDSLSIGSQGSQDTPADNEEFDRKDVLVFTVNLIDVSCRLLSCYTSQLQYTSPDSFLCASEHSLRSIYSVAIMMKHLLQKIMCSIEADGLNDQKVLHEIRVNGVNMGSMQPTPARQTSGLHTKCVHMFQHMYASRSSTRTQPRSYEEGPNDKAGDRKTQIIQID